MSNHQLDSLSSKNIKLSTTAKVCIIAVVVVLLDQILKFWVKTDFYLGESREITSWFSLTFVENNGMAFGWSVGSKIFLTLFRIVFIILLIYGLKKALKQSHLKTGFLICLALILSGAIGNIIDCLFYGVIFNNPIPPHTATAFLCDATSYGFLEGRVVDMLSFHLFSFDWPSWMPFIGGKQFDFFGPIFNIADAAISVGVISLILFYSKQISPFLNLFKTKKSGENALKD